jgi:DNA (cytosine-5)-methyltransferase 1
VTAYYNEIDPQAAVWLRNLITAGHIAPGEVDTRSITDVTAQDLRGFTQCHFFAGIGGWSHALRLAGYSDDRPVWTGSCPCQPFSVAGRQAGTTDVRHLWPEWFRLIKECRPPRIFGEQVEAAIRHGWLDLVQADLEGIGYAVGAAGLPAAGFGAPHIRQRLYFVADTDGRDASAERKQRGGQHGQQPQDGGVVRRLGDSERPRLEGHAGDGNDAAGRAKPSGSAAAPSGLSFWSECDWLPCRDGKARPVEPGTFPLAHGLSGRVVKLRAYGNAIVPQVAAAFIRASL